MIADAADLVVAGEIRVVTEAATILLRGGATLLEFCRIGVRRRLVRRQFGELDGIGAQIVVGEIFCQLIHRLGDALLLAKLIELDQNI